MMPSWFKEYLETLPNDRAAELYVFFQRIPYSANESRQVIYQSHHRLENKELENQLNQEGR